MFMQSSNANTFSLYSVKMVNWYCYIMSLLNNISMSFLKLCVISLYDSIVLSMTGIHGVAIKTEALISYHV